MGQQLLAIVRADAAVTPPSSSYASTRAGVVSLALAFVVAAAGSGYVWLQRLTETVPPLVAPLNVYEVFVDSTPLSVTVYAGGEYAPWQTTADAIRMDVALWRRMHLENWNNVPAELRGAGLDALLARFRPVLTEPPVWDRMTLHDWDAVPQPVRTVAYRQMVAYWIGFYDIGSQYGLPPGLVSETVAAIVMSESWFDHRAVHRDGSGNVDIGLAQASDYARVRMRQLHRVGVVDVDLAPDDYFNPWSATRFAALWFGFLLDEAGGSIDSAVRAYNRGIANAHDDRGSAYLAAVNRRLHRFIRNNGAPAAWAHVWQRGRTIEQEAWPWISD